MDWVIRKKDDHFDPYLIYAPDCELFTIRIHHGGKITGDKYKFYADGDVDHVDICNAERMSLHEVNHMVEELGHHGTIVYYYVEPDKDMSTGLRELCCDEDIINFCNWAYKFKVMEIYCDHKTNDEIQEIIRNSPMVHKSEKKKTQVTIEEIDADGNVLTKPCLAMVPRKRLFSDLDATLISKEKAKNKIDNPERGLLNDQMASKESKKDDGVGNENPQMATEVGNQHEVEMAAEMHRNDDGATTDLAGKRTAYMGSNSSGIGTELAGESAADMGSNGGGVGTDLPGESAADIGSNDNREEGDDNESEDGDDHFSEDGEFCKDDEMLGDQNDGQEASRNKETAYASTQEFEDTELHASYVNGGSQQPQGPQNEQSAPQNQQPVRRKQVRRRRKTTSAARKQGSTGEEDAFEEDIIANELHSDIGSSDDDNNEDWQGRYVDFNPDRDMRQPHFELGMKFESAIQFKLAIKNYSIWKGKPVKTYTNEAHRVRAKCKAPCKWFVYASVEKALGTTDLVIKTMHDEHTNCNHAWKNRYATAEWLSERYLERIRANMRMPIKELRQTVDEDYNIEISRVVAYRTRALAVKKIMGSAEAQYKNIWRYCEEIKKTHPNSTMEVMFTPFREEGCNPKFMRVYCCLGPLKQGFKEGCRPLIGLDGCHVKGAYPGQLLTAIGVDSNNGWWPIAWAVVEREATEQWRWFLELLKADLEFENQFSYTFISDQQKGLDKALSEVLPNCEHRYCVQHMYKNFKKKHPGKALKGMLWNIARSTNAEIFKKAMEDLENFDKGAFEWVKKAPHPSHWCKAFFSAHTKCDMLVNNLCESFNSRILEARDQPIIFMLESIREYLMERIQKRRTAMTKHELLVGPLIRKIIDERVIDSGKWKPIWNAVDGYQVKGPAGAQFAVYLNTKVCTCGLWEISGLPCCHAIAAIHRAGGDPYKEVDVCYSRDLFLKIYDNVLHPISGELMWPQSDMLELDPPLVVVQPGRPRKARQRDATEGKNHGKKLKRRVIIHCSKCGTPGHNAASCKVVPEEQQHVEDHQVEGQQTEGPVEGQQTEGQQVDQQQSSTRTKKQIVRRAKTSKRQQQHQQEQVQQQQVQQEQVQQQQEQVQQQQVQQQQEQVQQQVQEQQQPDLEQVQQQQCHEQQSLPQQSKKKKQPVTKSGKKKLTDADKGWINFNYSYLGKEPPYTVGNWKGRWRGRGRGRGKGTARGIRGDEDREGGAGTT